MGSGKTGATNVLRTLGPGPAAIVVLVDVWQGRGRRAAGALPVLGAIAHPGTARKLGLSLRDSAEAVAALAALLGHNYSLFIGFKGGRGVLTGAGAMTHVAAAPLFGAFGHRRRSG